MIELKNYPNNKDEFVGAETLMKFLHGRTSGVFSLEDSASVTAKQNQMAVQVSDGYGWMADSEQNGCVWWVDNKKETGQPAELPIDAADTALDRIDRVVVEWITTLYTEYPKLKVLKGANSSNPQPPALTNNTTTRQISLAQVLVKAGALKLTPADITDERLDPAVCGLVTYSEKIPTEMINAQFKELLATLKTQIEQTTSGAIPDGAVTSSKIADEAVTGKKLSADALQYVKENLQLTAADVSGAATKADIRADAPIYKGMPGKIVLFETTSSGTVPDKQITIPKDGFIQTYAYNGGSVDYVIYDLSINGVTLAALYIPSSTTGSYTKVMSSPIKVKKGDVVTVMLRSAYEKAVYLLPYEE